ncbi:hypothetical protein [Azospirillum sp. B2RO_4]|uniref:hypothetical protein n=1 Tax=Azospirillum sp. B2RO_4 TaxID=3027796 RepID=UPI003DA8EE3C
MGLDPVTLTAIGVGLSAVSTATAVYGSIQQGQAQSAALKAQQEQQRQHEEQLRTRAVQDEAARREELVANMSTMDAIRAGRGLSGTSPTALVIRNDATDTAMDDMRVSRLNILNGADSARQQGEQYGSAASTALTTGYLGAGKSLLDFGAKNSGLLASGGDTYGRGVKETKTGRLVGGI